MGDPRGGAAWAAGTEGGSKGERQGAAAARGRASRRSAPNSLGRARRGRAVTQRTAAAAAVAPLKYTTFVVEHAVPPGRRP